MGVIALVTGPDPGHALPVLGVARELRRRGHSTVVATGTQHAALVEAEGHAFLELPLLAPTVRDGDFGHVLWRRAGEMAPPLRDLLAARGVEVVVADTLTRAGAFTAALLDVPWVEVIPHHLPDPDPAVPPIGLGRLPSRAPWRRWSDGRIRRAQARSREQGRALRDEVLRSIGVARAPAPRARLVQSLPALEPPRTRWPAEAHLVGRLAIDPDLPALEPPSGDGPLVVVTDSTATGVATRTGSLAEVARAAFERAGVRLVVTSTRAPASRGDRVVVGVGPHDPLLASADLAIGPGGGGFVTKALTAGVPLVVVPQAGDQRETAGRVVWAGLGARIQPRRLTAARLARTAARVLADPQVAARAEACAVSARDLGPAAAAALVEDVLHEHDR